MSCYCCLSPAVRHHAMPAIMLLPCLCPASTMMPVPAYWGVLYVRWGTVSFAQQPGLHILCCIDHRCHYDNLCILARCCVRSESLVITLGNRLGEKNRETITFYIIYLEEGYWSQTDKQHVTYQDSTPSPHKKGSKRTESILFNLVAQH